MLQYMKIHMPLFTKLALLAAALAATGTAQADQVTFSNGDRISGQIIHVLGEEIQIATEYAGTICADYPRAVDMNTDMPGKILLTNGDILTGTIQSMSSEFVVIESGELGTLHLRRDEFNGYMNDEFNGYMNKEHAGNVPVEPNEAGDAVETPGGDSKQEKTNVATKEPAKEALDQDYWSGSFAAGAQLRRGNANASDVRTEMKATRKAEREELNLRFYSSYGETEGETYKNEVFGQAKLKIFKSDRLYVFGIVDMEYDEMEELDLRAQVFGGLGYHLIARDRTTLLAEAGAGLTGEFFDDDGNNETLEPSVILNAELTQKLFEHVVFYQGITLFPSMGDAGEFRVVSETSLTSPLGDGWAIKLSLIDQYDSNPENKDVEKNDMRFISGIEYTF